MKAVEQVTIDNPPISSQALDIFGEDVDSSDDSESDGIHFEVIPKPSAEHIKVAQEASKHALELSKDHKGSNTLYIGYVWLAEVVHERLLIDHQTHSSWLLRTPDEGILFTIWPGYSFAAVAQP